jgi:hypothetical protein
MSPRYVRVVAYASMMNEQRQAVFKKKALKYRTSLPG